jgi:hypothetical protein
MARRRGLAGAHMMAVAPRLGRPRVYLFFAALALGAAMVGFFTTFTRPLWRGEFHGPAIAYLHGAFVTAWLLLFLAQVCLVHSRQLPRHRLLGWSSVAVVPGVVLSTMAMGVYAMHRDLAAGGGELATSTLPGTFTTPLMFAALVAAGVAYRRRADFHKRLMLLATLLILWPAFFRFRHYFPGVPRPEFWFGFVLANGMIVLAVLFDWIATRRLHPVYATAGLAVIVEAGAETMMFDGPTWRVLSHWLAGFFLG